MYMQWEGYALWFNTEGEAAHFWTGLRAIGGEGQMVMAGGELAGKSKWDWLPEGMWSRTTSYGGMPDAHFRD